MGGQPSDNQIGIVCQTWKTLRAAFELTHGECHTGTYLPRFISYQSFNIFEVFTSTKLGEHVHCGASASRIRMCKHGDQNPDGVRQKMAIEWDFGNSSDSKELQLLLSEKIAGTVWAWTGQCLIDEITESPFCAGKLEFSCVPQYFHRLFRLDKTKCLNSTCSNGYVF